MGSNQAGGACQAEQREGLTELRSRTQPTVLPRSRANPKLHSLDWYSMVSSGASVAAPNWFNQLQPLPAYGGSSTRPTSGTRLFSRPVAEERT